MNPPTFARPPPNSAPPASLQQAAPPPPLPNPYELSGRRPPGQKPTKILPNNPSWALFADPATGLKYYLSRATGECTYNMPAPKGRTGDGHSAHERLPGSLQQSGDGDPEDSTVSHFESVLKSNSEGRRQDVVIPPPSLDTLPLESADPSGSQRIIRDVDMSLFKACRDGRGKNVLDRLIGMEDEEESDINVGWWKVPGGWDVVPAADDGKPTSFFWPAQLKPTSHARNPRDSTQGDSILHIAIKVRRQRVKKDKPARSEQMS